MSSFGENFENLENKILNVPSNIVDSMKRNNIANSIVLLLLLYVILAAPTMSPTVVKLFNNNFFKLVYIFLVMCLVSQNPILSLVVAVVLLVVLNKLLEPKPHVIPEANVVNKPIVLQPGAVVTTTASGQTVVLPPSVMAQNNVEHFSFAGLGNDSAAMTLGGAQQTAGSISNLFGSGNASPGTVATSVLGGGNDSLGTRIPNVFGSGNDSAGTRIPNVFGSGNDLAGTIATSVLGGGNASESGVAGNIAGVQQNSGGVFGIGNGISQSASGNLSGATNIKGISQSASGNLSGATNMSQGISGISQSASGNLSGATNMSQGISGISQSASGNLSGATNMSQGKNISGITQTSHSVNNPTAGPSTNIDGERLLRENVKLTSAESSNLYNSLAKFYSDPKIKKSDELHMAEKLKQKYFPSVNFSNAVLGQKKDEIEMSCKLVCDNKKVEKFENEETNDRLTQRQQMMNLWQANQSKVPAVLPAMEQENNSCASVAVNSSCDVLGVNNYHSTSHARVSVDNNPCPEDGEIHGVYENIDKEYAWITSVDKNH
jgi:hypothetical protein